MNSTGSSRGSVENQYIKKTILTTGHCFPYMKTRIKIKEKFEVILTPIEVAIEDMVAKLGRLNAAIINDRLTLLQMELQSCVATVVMAGPLEIARTFLRSITILSLNSLKKYGSILVKPGREAKLYKICHSAKTLL